MKHLRIDIRIRGHADGSIDRLPRWRVDEQVPRVDASGAIAGCDRAIVRQTGIGGGVDVAAGREAGDDETEREAIHDDTGHMISPISVNEVAAGHAVSSSSIALATASLLDSLVVKFSVTNWPLLLLLCVW